MKKVLVTGAAGFIGSHLCEQLIQQGYSVRAFVRYNSTNNWGWLQTSPLLQQIEVVTGDIRDFDSVNAAVKGVDAVFHLAALIGIPYSYQSPLAYVKTNVEGTYNILEACRRDGTQRVLVTSTSEVYGSALFVPISEAHPMQPQSPYSASKIGADNLALSYWNSFKTPVVVARPFNTFGPRQSARAIIPTIVSQLLHRKSKIRLGNTAPVRDLTFVTDTVLGLIDIAKTDHFLGKTVNIGVGEGISIKDLYEKLAVIAGHRAELEIDAQRVRPSTSEVMRLISDNAMLKANTKWRPQHTLDAGLEQTVAWIGAHLDQFKADIYNV